MLIFEQRQQLLSVIAHAQVTLFSVDRNRKLNLIEGSFIWNLDGDIGSGDERGSGKASKSEELIGQNVYDVFFSTKPGARRDQIPPSLQAVEDILTGKTIEDVNEHCIENRWYRTRFLPILGKKGDAGK
jgi:hypothetical protein